MENDNGRIYYGTGLDNSQLRAEAAEARNILQGIGTSAEQEGDRIDEALGRHGRRKVAVKTVMTAAPAVMEAFKQTDRGRRLLGQGVVLSHICPLMYMNNPKCATMPVITCSNKLRTYTSAKYYKEDELLEIITGGAR